MALDALVVAVNGIVKGDCPDAGAIACCLDLALVLVLGGIMDGGFDALAGILDFGLVFVLDGILDVGWC